MILDYLYQRALNLHRALKRPHVLKHPVVSVGNISVGGRGKTPVVSYLASELKKKDFTPVILTRGYGRKISDPFVLDSRAFEEKKDLVDHTGDEALELFVRCQCPVLVGADRYKNALKYLEGPVPFEKIIFILDDGFQHWALYRDFDLVLIDPKDRKDKTLPWGRLRESMSALERAHSVWERGLNFDKRSVLPKNLPANLLEEKEESVFFLSTRVKDAAYRSFLEQKIPGIRALELKDHADKDRIFSALEAHKVQKLFLGMKEAVKVLKPGELVVFYKEGFFKKEFSNLSLELYFVDFQLEIKNDVDFWKHLLSVLNRQVRKLSK